jgi:hypothetical protein
VARACVMASVNWKSAAVDASLDRNVQYSSPCTYRQDGRLRELLTELQHEVRAADKRRNIAAGRSAQLAAELERVRASAVAEAQARHAEQERSTSDLRQRAAGAEQRARAMEARFTGELEARTARWRRETELLSARYVATTQRLQAAEAAAAAAKLALRDETAAKAAEVARLRAALDKQALQVAAGEAAAKRVAEIEGLRVKAVSDARRREAEQYEADLRTLRERAAQDKAATEARLHEELHAVTAGAAQEARRVTGLQESVAAKEARCRELEQENSALRRLADRLQAELDTLARQFHHHAATRASPRAKTLPSATIVATCSAAGPAGPDGMASPRLGAGLAGGSCPKSGSGGNAWQWLLGGGGGPAAVAAAWSAATVAGSSGSARAGREGLGERCCAAGGDSAVDSTLQGGTAGMDSTDGLGRVWAGEQGRAVGGGAVPCLHCGIVSSPALVFAQGPHHGRRCPQFAWAPPSSTPHLQPKPAHMETLA